MPVLKPYVLLLTSVKGCKKESAKILLVGGPISPSLCLCSALIESNFLTSMPLMTLENGYNLLNESKPGRTRLACWHLHIIPKAIAILFLWIYPLQHPKEQLQPVLMQILNLQLLTSLQAVRGTGVNPYLTQQAGSIYCLPRQTHKQRTRFYL